MEVPRNVDELATRVCLLLTADTWTKAATIGLEYSRRYGHTTNEACKASGVRKLGAMLELFPNYFDIRHTKGGHPEVRLRRRDVSSHGNNDRSSNDDYYYDDDDDDDDDGDIDVRREENKISTSFAPSHRSESAAARATTDSREQLAVLAGSPQFMTFNSRHEIQLEAMDAVLQEGRSLVAEDQPAYIPDVSEAKEMDLFLSIFPQDVQAFVREQIRRHTGEALLIDVCVDIGRRPAAYFRRLKPPSGEDNLDSPNMRHQGMNFCVSHSRRMEEDDVARIMDQLPRFDGNNRTGIDGTLHRFCRIVHTTMEPIGLTARVGRCLHGVARLVDDIAYQNQSILFIGYPGVGKTTVIRELAKLKALNLQQRVVIVDTSNEIAGHGRCPHHSVGSARRLPVPDIAQQHKVLVEAVQNHTPEVIVADEIGSKAEAQAVSSICQRGVSVIATAHGRTLRDLVTSSDLVQLLGGKQTVILSASEAQRRGLPSKTIQERCGEPAFQIAIEIRTTDEWIVHTDVKHSVDSLLAGRPFAVERRKRHLSGGRLTHMSYQRVEYDQ